MQQSLAAHSADSMVPAFRVRSAIARRQLVLQYQPIVDLRTGSIFAVEALVRWRHPAAGLLGPSKFLPAIDDPEDHRLLDLWVLETASHFIHGIRTAGGQPVLLSVNVSPQHLSDTSSIVHFAEAIHQGEFDPTRLILELTESAALRDTECAGRSITRLKRLGVRFAIDDFGTGFASLDYLARLPADVLKIDRSFIGSYGDEKHGAIIEAVVNLAQRLNIAVVMEGIERHDQLAFAALCNVPYAQGFLFAEPLEPAEVQELLATPRRHRPLVSWVHSQAH